MTVTHDKADTMNAARAVLFDLDGTLLDTLADLAGAMNEVLAAGGRPVHPVDAYRLFVGDGARALVRRALPPPDRDDATVEATLAAYQQSYEAHWNRTTRPYPGIKDLLAALRQRGVPLAVLTNKPQAFAERCVAAHFAAGTFAEVLGQCDTRPRKPDPAGAWALAQALGVAPAQCLLVGDSAVDIETARAAGMTAVGVRWGFRDADELRTAGAAVLLDEPRDLLPLLNG